MRAAIAVIAAMLAVALLAWKLCYVQPPTIPASLPQKWHEQLYELDEKENVRLIPPPHSNLRAQLVAGAQPGVYPAAVFYTHRSSLRPLRRLTTLDDILRSVATEKASQSLSLEELSVDGDWLVRTEASAERRVSALDSILEQVTGKDLIFEKLIMYQELHSLQTRALGPSGDDQTRKSSEVVKRLPQEWHVRESSKFGDVRRH